jgi:hypothetical protein
MTDSDRKSMDDVLASIRRIVRAEKESGVASASGNGPQEDADRDAGRRVEAEEPLVLTSEMRTDGGGPPAPARPELGAEAAEASDLPEAPDREALRATLRELLREELSGGPAEEAVRGVIRDELTKGQVGRNISQNVLRLIREEVAKAVQAPR